MPNECPAYFIEVGDRLLAVGQGFCVVARPGPEGKELTGYSEAISGGETVEGDVMELVRVLREAVWYLADCIYSGPGGRR